MINQKQVASCCGVYFQKRIQDDEGTLPGGSHRHGLVDGCQGLLARILSFETGGKQQPPGMDDTLTH